MICMSFSLTIALLMLITIYVNNVNGECGGHIFVTPLTYAPGANWEQANAATSNRFNSIAQADSICQYWAGQSSMQSLRGNFKAVLSDASVDAKTRFGYTDLDICLPDGHVVAHNTEQVFSGSLELDLNQRSDGVVLVGPNKVWTGSLLTGDVAVDLHCSGWSSTSGNGNAGKTDQVNHKALAADSSNACSMSYHLYCMEVIPLRPPQRPCRRMFVTSTVSKGDFGIGAGLLRGPHGADERCDAASRGPDAVAGIRFYVEKGFVEYQAIFGSGSENAFTRVGLDEAECVELVDNTLLWAGAPTGMPFHLSEGTDIFLDEQGNDVGARKVWTNCEADGEHAALAGDDNCANWSDNTNTKEATYGKADQTDGAFLNFGTETCDREYSFYCVSVPVPTSQPTDSPTKHPTDLPTKPPTLAPTKMPTLQPATKATSPPSEGPTVSPGAPSRAPTLRPTTSATAGTGGTTAMQTGTNAGSTQNIVPNSTTPGETDSVLVPLLLGIFALLCVCLLILCLFLLLRRRRRRGHIRDPTATSATLRPSTRHTTRRTHVRQSRRLSARHSRSLESLSGAIEDGMGLGVQWLSPSGRASTTSEAANNVYGRAPHVPTSQPTATNGAVYEKLPNASAGGNEIVYETLPEAKEAGKGKQDIIYGGLAADASTQTELRVPKKGAI